MPKAERMKSQIQPPLTPRSPVKRIIRSPKVFTPSQNPQNSLKTVHAGTISGTFFLDPPKPKVSNRPRRED